MINIDQDGCLQFSWNLRFCYWMMTPPMLFGCYAQENKIEQNKMNMIKTDDWRLVAMKVINVSRNYVDKKKQIKSNYWVKICEVRWQLLMSVNRTQQNKGIVLFCCSKVTSHSRFCMIYPHCDQLEILNTFIQTGYEHSQFLVFFLLLV